MGGNLPQEQTGVNILCLSKNKVYQNSSWGVCRLTNFVQVEKIEVNILLSSRFSQENNVFFNPGFEIKAES